jgi:hypothetical protein
MAKVTVLFGVLLIILGAASYILTGHKFPTSLIPVAFGILLATFGSMAETPDSRRRMLFMHIAVTVGLLGFLATAPALIQVVQLFKGTKLFLYRRAVEEKAAMSGLMLIYVLLCVRSFIAARRSRV